MIVAVDPKLAAVAEMVVAGTAVDSNSVAAAELEPLGAIPAAVAVPTLVVPKAAALHSALMVADSIPVVVPGIAVAVVPARPVP
jgi:hypothetical protein